MRRHLGKEEVWGSDGQDCATILACCAWLDFASVGVDEVLRSVANAEDGDVFAYAERSMVGAPC